MELIQFITIMATMLGGFSFIYKEFKNDISELKKEIHEDNISHRENANQTSARTDKLYEMFIDLLKDRRDKQ